MVEPTSRIRRKKLLLEPSLRERSIYLLPNLFTTAALFAGFYAIVQAMNGRFEHSAVAIFIAMVMDGLDGRVAHEGSCVVWGEARCLTSWQAEAVPCSSWWGEGPPSTRSRCRRRR